MTVKNIIYNATIRLELEGKLLMPDSYAEAFCKEAQRAGILVEDCSHMEKFIKTLNKDFQLELMDYRIKTMDELTRFLIAKLNRTDPSQCIKKLETQIIFTKKVLQVVELLHNKDASMLAKRSFELLNTGGNSAQMEQFKQLWINFASTYDDSFLDKLKSVGSVDDCDLKKTIDNLNLSLEPSGRLDKNIDLSGIASLIISSLTPSIAASVSDEIISISDRIQKDPSSLGILSVEEEIRNAISLRIALDKQSVKNMITSLDGVLDKLSSKLITMIERSDTSNHDIQTIKHDLEVSSDEASTNFKIAHKKLFMIAVALEKNTEDFSSELKKHNNEVAILTQHVHDLKEELAAIKKESKEDFLTKIYNRRALNEFLLNREAEFKRNGRNFSIVMFDLDKFKSVNDTYGHEAGDAILSAFSKILSQEARNVDIVGRYGGEEFMVILSETDTKGAVVFAEKVRVHVQNAHFLYKDQRIDITISAGVCERKVQDTIERVINSADEYLYQAKNNGRNQVAYKQ